MPFNGLTYYLGESETIQKYLKATADAIETIYGALAKLSEETDVLLINEVHDREDQKAYCLPILTKEGEQSFKNGWCTEFTKSDQKLREAISEGGEAVYKTLDLLRQIVIYDPDSQSSKDLH